MAATDDESKKSQAQLSNGHISSKNSKWLAENVEEVNQSFNQILKLIEQDEEPFAEKPDVYYERWPKLIAHVEDILHKHHLLAEQYDQLQGILCCNKSSAFHMQNIGDSMDGLSKGSCLESPDPKSVIHKVECEGSSPDSSLRSDGGSSEISSDSDSESYKSSTKKSSMSPFDAGKMWEDDFVDKEKEIDIVEMRGRITKYEEELRISNRKLQFSEEQVSRLKKEIEEIVGNFKFQLESAKSEIQEREADLEREKKKVLELQMEVSSLETHVLDSNGKIGILEMELEVSKEKLTSSEEEISNLKSGHSDESSDYTHLLKNQLESAQQEVVLLVTKLDSEKKQASEMQDRIQRYQADISDRDDEIKNLGAALQDTTRKFSVDEAELQSHISTMSEHLMLVEGRAEEWEMRSKLLEKEFQQSEADKTKMQRLHEAQEIRWKNDFDYLKAELNEKGRLVDLLNKDLDGFKLKFDELMAEKDGAFAKIQILGAELDSKDNEIQQMKGHLHQLHLENVQLISASEIARKQYEDLRLRVQELEKEVESQKVVISDRAEEKREAIRQLCFSLEHYRNGYKELRQAYSGYKRRVIMAS